MTDFFVALGWLFYTRFRSVGQIQHRTLDKLSGNVKYNAYLYEKFRGSLGKRVLEVGPGIGNITQFLIRNRDLLVAVEKSSVQKFYLSQRIPESSIFKVLQKDIETEPLDELSNLGLETAVCINVLEHINDDAGALNKIRGVINEDGRLVLIVPAYQWLFSGFDRQLGHCRRYNKKGLSELLDRKSVV